MFARVARYEVPEERMVEAVEAFREAARELEDVEGLRGGYVLSDPESGTVLTMTLWDNRAALDNSDVRAARLRQNAARQAGGSVESVHCLEVAAELGRR